MSVGGRDGCLRSESVVSHATGVWDSVDPATLLLAVSYVLHDATIIRQMRSTDNSN